MTNLLKHHIKEVVNQDFLLKYQGKTPNILPIIKKVTLSGQFPSKTKEEIVTLFEILTFHKPVVTQSRRNILSLGLRKGNLVGIKLVLRKKACLDFLMFFLFNVLPESKNFQGFKQSSKTFHWEIKDISSLNEISPIYMYVSNLSRLDIAIDGNNLNSMFFEACRFPRKI
jgi:ribosomal protein L5